MDRGFITPSSLHYVRNHGPVPKLNWKDHRLEVKGLVDTPKTFTMNEIAAMPQVGTACLYAFKSRGALIESAVQDPVSTP